jgi:feruloyl esterase
MRLIRFLIAILVLGFCSAPLGASAQDLAAACTALAGAQRAAQYSKIPDAPTAILSAKIIPAGGDGSIIEKDLPEICRVEGQIAPSVGFLLRMPTKNWNGKFLMGGCGGACGNYLTDRTDPALIRNYAVVVTDMGHKGDGWSFGYNNLQGLIDFGYRATHVTAVAAKIIVADFYSQKPAHSYFAGCSTGGRQALIEAEQFPRDFEGITVGSPVWTQTMHSPLIDSWGPRINTGADGKPILTVDKLPMIHQAVLDACDMIDGLKDGVIQNPLKCHWDPASIQCKAGADPSKCLTADQVGVVKKIYQGATWSDGSPMYLGQGGPAYGSELKWKGELEAQNGRDEIQKYLSIYAAPGPSFDSSNFNIDRDIPGLALTEILFSPRNPDLRNFRAAGGKMILYNGWDDTCCSAKTTIDFYETVTRLIGEKESKDFLRLFLPAGMDHCRYGIGGGEVDWLTPLENWVEKGQAPEQVTAYHMVKEPYAGLPRPNNEAAPAYVLIPRYPLPADTYDRAHPVYAYPDWPKYSGKGDAKDPANWQKGPRS